MARTAGVDPARDLAQIVQRAGHHGDGAIEFRAKLAELGRHRGPCRARLQRQRNQRPLGAVVQILLDPSARLVGGGHDPRPRRSPLGIRDRGRGQLGEPGQLRLGAGGQRRASGRYAHDAPQSALDPGRHADRRRTPSSSRAGSATGELGQLR